MKQDKNQQSLEFSMDDMSNSEKPGRYVILLRHGRYSVDYLTSAGIDDVEKVARDILSITGNTTAVYIASSNTNRARESAEIISKAFGKGEVDQRLELFGDFVCHEKLESIDRLIEQHNTAKVIVFVTHLEIMKEYPQYFHKRAFGVECPDISEFNNGEGICFDMIAKKYILLK
jgi:phosphohistidine phosphatase SixA